MTITGDNVNDQQLKKSVTQARRLLTSLKTMIHATEVALDNQADLPDIKASHAQLHEMLDEVDVAYQTLCGVALDRGLRLPKWSDS